MQDLETLLALEADEVKFEEIKDDYYPSEVRETFSVNAFSQRTV